jgi:hypothetical protein
VNYTRHANNLYLAFNGRLDVKELNLYAERVIIRDPLTLPHTNLKIYARQLIFEDKPGNISAYISTTPNRDQLQPAESGKEGMAGMKAGNITLYIKEFISNPAYRFFQIGGDGQDGVKNPQSQNILSTGGSGGDGGDLYSVLNVDKFSNRFGGSAGEFRPLDAKGHRGNTGKFQKLNSSYSWVHPNYLRLVLRHSDDAFYSGFPDLTFQRLSDYNYWIFNYKLNQEWKTISDTLRTELNQLEQEFHRTISQTESGMDYFGNPKGWVPMLSFEVNAAVFRSEIQHAVDVIYLNHWISKSSQKIQDRIKAFSDARTLVITRLNQDRNEFKNNIINIDNLEIQAKRNANSLDSIQSKLLKLEKELVDRANHIVEQRNEEARRQAKKNEWKNTFLLLLPLLK